MTLFELFIIACWAVYRLTMMLNEEDGPAHIFRRMRVRIGVVYDERDHATAKNWFAEGVLCFYCLSVWVGIGITLLLAVFIELGHARTQTTWNYSENVALLIMPFATSGVAIFLKKFGG
jgi:hypothetical protein